MKIPEPIIDPATIIVESRSPRPRINPSLVSGPISATSVALIFPVQNKFCVAVENRGTHCGEHKSLVPRRWREIRWCYYTFIAVSVECLGKKVWGYGFGLAHSFSRVATI